MEGHARGVQIDLKADMLSLRYPMKVKPRRRQCRDAARAAAAVEGAQGHRTARQVLSAVLPGNGEHCVKGGKGGKRES